jgi:membrane-bound metal-dependent hydrolase YbcI (DUF457 family)
MFFWFIGVGTVVVALVFQSPALDYRMVMLGLVLPLADGVTGGQWFLHTLLAPVAVLVIVMLATRRRRLVRRRWIGLPIGMFVHLVLDGVWTDAHAFWWPLFGTSFEGGLPEVDRGAASLVLELIGVAAIVWGWRRFGFDDPRARAQFVRTGRLPRGLSA